MVASTDLKVCVPGERLLKAGPEYKIGDGTYVLNGQIRSSLAGYLHIVPSANIGEPALVEVRREDSDRCSVPFVDAIVTCKVTAINAKYCKVCILCVHNAKLRGNFNGMIRKEDVRLTEKDAVEMHKCFRPGDIVLAKVISLGDAQSYLLTTAEDSLGVVQASCESGHKLELARSLTEMYCAVEGMMQARKVAKLPSLSENSGASLPS